MFARNSPRRQAPAYAVGMKERPPHIRARFHNALGIDPLIGTLRSATPEVGCEVRGLTPGSRPLTSGEGGIRTRGTCDSTRHFQCRTFGLSVTSPETLTGGIEGLLTPGYSQARGLPRHDVSVDPSNSTSHCNRSEVHLAIGMGCSRVAFVGSGKAERSLDSDCHCRVSRPGVSCIVEPALHPR